MLDVSRIERSFEKMAVEIVRKFSETPSAVIGSPILFEFRTDS
jgi:hypothetical protein